MNPQISQTMKIILEQAQMQAYVGIGEEKQTPQTIVIDLVMEIDEKISPSSHQEHHGDVVCYKRSWDIIMAQCTIPTTYLEDLARVSLKMLFKSDKRITSITIRIIKKQPINMRARAGIEITQTRSRTGSSPAKNASSCRNSLC